MWLKRRHPKHKVEFIRTAEEQRRYGDIRLISPKGCVEYFDVKTEKRVSPNVGIEYFSNILITPGWACAKTGLKDEVDILWSFPAAFAVVRFNVGLIREYCRKPKNRTFYMTTQKAYDQYNTPGLRLVSIKKICDLGIARLLFVRSGEQPSADKEFETYNMYKDGIDSGIKTITELEQFMSQQ